MPRSAIQPGRALAAAAVCAASGVASAAEWSMQPVLQARTDFNTNRRLLVRDEQSNAGLWLTLDPTFARSTETGDITFHPRVELQRYSEDKALNANNLSFQLSARHLGERYGLTAQAGYARDSTLTTELAETGIIDTSTHRATLSGSANGAVNLSMRQSLSVQASYANVEYPNGERFGLIGYRYPSLSTTYTYAPTTLTSLNLTAFGDVLTAPASDYKARELGVRAGIDHAISERWRVSASAGVSQTHTGEQGIFFFGFFIPTSPAHTDRGSVWSLHLTRFADLTQWTLAYDRNVQPSGVGVLVRRDILNLSATRHLSSRLNATMSLQRYVNDNFSANQHADDRRYLTGDAGLDWHASEQMVLNVSAGYSQSQLVSFEQRATGWRSAFGIRWTPDRWSASR